MCGWGVYSGKIPIFLIDMFSWGFSFGSVVGQPVAGFLASSWLGWPAPFYLYGGFGLIWTVFWIIFGASSPADHKSITQNEREYIETSLGVQKNENVSYIKPHFWKHYGFASLFYYFKFVTTVYWKFHSWLVCHVLMVFVPLW